MPEPLAGCRAGSTSHIYGCENPGCSEKARVEVDVWDVVRGWVRKSFCLPHDPSTISARRHMIDNDATYPQNDAVHPDAIR